MKNIWDDVWNSEKGYSTSIFRKDVQNKIMRIFKNDKIHDKSVLEIGCGDGEILKNLNAKMTHGIDISSVAIDKAKKNFSKGKFSVDNVLDLQIESNTYDYVFSIGVIEHFRELEKVKKAIKEHIRVTKNGGKIVIMVPNKLSFGRVQRKYKILLNKWQFGYQTEFSPNEMKEMFRELGVSNIMIETYSVYKPKKLDSFTFIYYIDKIWGYFRKNNKFHLYITGIKDE